jgi:hypothetical protein
MIRCAILIIGSLLWDNGSRDAWRRSRLRIGDGIPVRVPIRYGRQSKTRGDTFTMTLDSDGGCGRGYLVPCLASPRDIVELVDEAVALWAAEDRRAPVNAISADWGCVGATFRQEPTFSDWVTAWADHFGKHGCPTTPVAADGILRIPWPLNVFDDRPVDADVILAAATAAVPTRPRVTEIADAWVNQHAGHERYFLENVRRGIRTPDDGAIWQRIEDKRPPWLDADHHREAIEILRSEARQPA